MCNILPHRPTLLLHTVGVHKSVIKQLMTPINYIQLVMPKLKVIDAWDNRSLWVASLSHNVWWVLRQAAGLELAQPDDPNEDMGMSHMGGEISMAFSSTCWRMVLGLTVARALHWNTSMYLCNTMIPSVG